MLLAVCCRSLLWPAGAPGAVSEDATSSDGHRTFLGAMAKAVLQRPPQSQQVVPPVEYPRQIPGKAMSGQRQELRAWELLAGC